MTAHATFDGKQYKAANLRIENAPKDEDPKAKLRCSRADNAASLQRVRAAPAAESVLLQSGAAAARHSIWNLPGGTHG